MTNMTAATRYASFATDGYDSDPTQLDRWVDAACREYGLLEPRNDLDDLLRLLCFDPEIGQAVTRPPGKPNAWESFAWFSDHAKRGKRGQPSAAPPARVDVLRTAEETASGLRQQS